MNDDQFKAMEDISKEIDATKSAEEANALRLGINERFVQIMATNAVKQSSKEEIAA